MYYLLDNNDIATRLYNSTTLDDTATKLYGSMALDNTTKLYGSMALDDTATKLYDSMALDEIKTNYHLHIDDSWANTSSVQIDTDPRKRIRQMIRERSAPRMVFQREGVVRTTDIREIRARQTLRKCVGEARFRQFLKCGWITIKAKSGRVYKIGTGHEMAVVYENGKPIEKLCAILTGDFPPTDALIMRFLVLLNDEQLFISKAVRHAFHKGTWKPRPVDDRPLTDIMRELKVA